MYLVHGLERAGWIVDATERRSEPKVCEKEALFLLLFFFFLNPWNPLNPFFVY
jgi:hypothetical protein